MQVNIKSTAWIYTIVIISNKNEQLLGQIDYKNNISFIPVFKKRADAEKGIQLLSIKDKSQCEVQAIIYEDLLKYASKEGFKIFILDKNGNIEHHIDS